MCNDCNGAWEVPTVTIYALCYWIIAVSCIDYLLKMWANQYTEPSMICIYGILIPLTSTVVSEMLILTHLIKQCTNSNDDKCLYSVNLSDLGAFGIVIGLCLVIHSDKKYKKKMKKLENDMNNDRNVNANNTTNT